jgi:hypothetical protein
MHGNMNVKFMLCEFNDTVLLLRLQIASYCDLRLWKPVEGSYPWITVQYVLVYLRIERLKNNN